MTLLTFDVIKVLMLAALSSMVAMLFAPFLINFLCRINFWKKDARTKSIDGSEAKIVNSLNKDREVCIPRGGGILIWGTTLVITVIFFLLSFVENPWWLEKFNFLSREGTWLPLFTLIASSILGLIDDTLTVYGKGKYIGGGLSFWRRLAVVSLIGLVGGWWFYYKLGWMTIHIPLLFNFPEGIDLSIGILYIPLFVIVMIASWAGGVIDGIDGLSGGIFASIFGAFTIISFAGGNYDLATFCAIICGTLFAFLWFNIPPAKFYMGETGSLGLTSTMAVVAFLTDSVVILPIIAGLMVVEVGSIILQLLSKKIRHKKIWLSTPIHHHFQAKGWSSPQVTMRFWVISIVFAILGTVLRLMSGYGK
jgi:phospho-N-acetylmuramoyl-pentapeptide-transferase